MLLKLRDCLVPLIATGALGVACGEAEDREVEADAAAAVDTAVEVAGGDADEVSDSVGVNDASVEDLVSSADIGHGSGDGGVDETDVRNDTVDTPADVRDPLDEIVDPVYEPCTLEGGPVASVSGHAMPFGPSSSWTIEGARVTILELPGREAFTGADSSFRFDDVPVGCEVSLVLEAEGRPLIQTGTHVVPDDGLERITFQAPDDYTKGLLERFARTEADDRLCQIATTVTRIGNSLYDATPGSHGEPGATVSIDPVPEYVDGPIYFEMVRYNVIYPLRTLTQTTYDGGVLFLNVLPGRYTLRAQKEGAEIAEVDIKCRAGLIVNASPPWGLQVLSGGVGPRDPEAEF